VKFTDLGTGEGIGANCQLLEIGPFRIVVDAGLNPRETGNPSLPRLDSIGAEPDAIVLTHCHLDHLGALPLLGRLFPEVPILMSLPSSMLAPRMLHISVSVMTRQREELGLPELPLYTHGEVERLFTRVIPLKFALPRFLDKGGDSLEICLHQAGHVAGAACVEFKWGSERILHTGDILFDAQRHLAGAKPPKGPCSVLITETTRGGATRPEGFSREDETMRLLETIEKTIARGGSVLIPVFALGRAQELFCILHESRNLLPKVPIYSAGLGLDLAEKFDEITRKTGLVRFRSGVLRDLKVQILERDLRPGRSPRQGIYLLSSGMMTESTPSYVAAASLLHDAKNTVCIVGYCDPDTPGGQLMETEPGGDFLFDKLDYQTPLEAQVERFDLSGHADREELLAYACEAAPARVILVHGEEASRQWFLTELEKALPGAAVLIPEQLRAYDLPVA